MDVLLLFQGQVQDPALHLAAQRFGLLGVHI